MDEVSPTIVNLGGIEIKLNSLICWTGKYKAGKSASCFLLCEKFLEKGLPALYIETEGKINNQTVLKTKNYKFLDKIDKNFELVKLFYEEKNDGKFINFFAKLEDEIKTKGFKLIIIDSYTFPFLSIDGQKSKWFGNVTMRFFIKLLDLAVRFNLCVVVVNQILVWDKEEHIKGGDKLGFVPNMIVYCREENQNYWWEYHTFSVPFIIEKDGSILKIG